MYKVGDWCFHDFELCLIKDMKDNHVTEVTTGWINTSGNDLDVRPLTLRNKRISENVESTSNKIHEEGNCGLNYPDIHTHLVELWLNACDTEDTAAGNEEANKILSQVCIFREKVLKFSQNSPKVDGVRILGR
jgi:hypothetical protein